MQATLKDTRDFEPHVTHTPAFRDPAPILCRKQRGHAFKGSDHTPKGNEKQGRGLQLLSNAPHDAVLYSTRTVAKLDLHGSYF